MKNLSFINMEFKKEGFPIIKLKDDCLEIQAFEYLDFRTFRYDELIEVDYYNNRNKWWFRMYIFGNIFGSCLSEVEPYKFKLKKKNGADWAYDCPPDYDQDFAKFILEIMNRSGMKIVKK